MKFFNLIVKNKVTVYILVVIIVLMGSISYISLPREAAPSVKIPYVFIATVYPGATPEDMESLVTQEIEKEVKSISGVKKITSVSRESLSSIQVEFNIDVNIDFAIQKVRDKVATAKVNMPQEIKEPVITEINFSELPIIYVNVTGNFGLWKLKELSDRISDKIIGIPGVLSADVVGGVDREVKIDVDADKIKYFDISMSDVAQLVGAENLNVPSGKADIGKNSYQVRVPGEYVNPEDMANLIVKKDGNNSVYLRDIATVTYGFAERKTFSRENGDESVTLVIKKRTGANVLEIIDNVKEIVKDKELVPDGVKVTFSGDNSKLINRTVHELENGIITGMLLVFLILFLFMGVKNAVLVATSIPLSFLIAFTVLSMFGITLNMIVLFTLIVVLGIIVDDAVVVLENIYRLQENENYSPRDAAVEGPNEVVFPVVIATLTIIASFSPLLFFPGITGDFIKYMPITMIVCLLSSLFVAMIITPVQAAVFVHFKRDKEKSKKKKFRPIGKFLEFFDKKFFGTSLRLYEKALRYSLVHKKLTISGTILLFIVVIFIYMNFNFGSEFFPKTEPRMFNINITTPIGTSIYQTNNLSKEVEKRIPKLKDIDYVISNVGSSNNPLDFSGDGIPNKSTISVNFVDKEFREQSSFISQNETRDSIKNIAGGEIEVVEQSMGPPVGKPINIEISGDDFDKLGDYADKIKREIKDIPGLADLQDDYDKTKPEIRVIVDRDKAALYGLNTAMIGTLVRTAINGATASKFRVEDKQYDVTVRLEPQQRNDIEYISNLYITNTKGIKVPITSVAKIEFGGGIGSITRINSKRVITVSANAVNRLGNDVLKDVQVKLSGMKFEPGYSIKYTGEQEDQKETANFLMQALVIALLLIFFLMVIEFNSIRVPFIIMISVMLSLIGVLLGLMITATPFGILMSGIGIIALAGIVVRNAIVLLDFQKELVKRGLTRDESLVQAGIIRIRPIFLTAAATILGIIPLATGVDFDWRAFHFVLGGENTAFWRPMGVAIIFGLAFSTFLTLIIIPSIFASFDDVMLRLKRKRKVTEE